MDKNSRKVQKVNAVSQNPPYREENVDQSEMSHSCQEIDLKCCKDQNSNFIIIQITSMK